MTQLFDLPYVKCDPCIDDDHDHCEGDDPAKPICGCKCPWLVTLTGDDHVE